MQCHVTVPQAVASRVPLVGDRRVPTDGDKQGPARLRQAGYRLLAAWFRLRQCSAIQVWGCQAGKTETMSTYQ